MSETQKFGRTLGLVDRDSTFYASQTHIISSTSQTHTPQYSTFLVTMPKGKRGLSFTVHELVSLVETIEEILPISHTEWDRVRDQHNKFFPDQNQTSDSHRRKFQWTAKLKMPTGDPNMPHHIHIAKRANYAIVKTTDGSMETPGGKFDDDDNDANAEEDDEEGGEGDSLANDSDEEEDEVPGGEDYTDN